jgi:hypothetical protein
MCPKALRKLASIMEDPTASEQIRAAEAILDRSLGKVVEFRDQRGAAQSLLLTNNPRAGGAGGTDGECIAGELRREPE